MVGRAIQKTIELAGLSHLLRDHLLRDERMSLIRRDDQSAR